MKHAEKVLASVECKQSAARSRIVASWSRSALHYGLDPSLRRSQEVETLSELSTRREKSDLLLHVAGKQLDQLFNLVGASGCSVVLTDREGYILDQRSRSAESHDFAGWGLLPGANWSEGREGTNGIGTCLAEQRNVIIHRDQHFFPKNIDMTCIGSPIYGSLGELLGALDVSSARVDKTESMNSLLANTVEQAAKQIEAANFCAAYAGERIVIVGASSGNNCALVAINSDDCIVGATRGARKIMGWACDGELQPVAATDFFDDTGDLRGFNRAERTAVVKAITRANGNISNAAKALGVGRATLYRRMKRLGIRRED